MPFRSPAGGRVLPAALALLATLAIAALLPPSGSAQTDAERRAAAEKTLERAQRLADGRGVRTGRELSHVLAELAAQRSALSRSDRREADQLLARPTDPADVDQPGGPFDPTVEVLRNCSANFCVHWVQSTADAPPLANADQCPTPDYVDRMRTSLEQSHEVQNGQLDWNAPVADGNNGGDSRSDVYIKELNPTDDTGLYGYAAIDPGQSGLSRSAFLVLDDDYAQDEFPQYGGDFLVPLQVTAAHEYNHVLQYGYDTFQDVWMFEATATWAEEKVFPGHDDYHGYMGTWANRPWQPITSADGTKMYGSAIFNHWLEQRYGAEVVRRAWEESVASGDFAPGAYDAAIRSEGGPGFPIAFADFAASTAEWDAANSGIHEGAAFPRDVDRLGTVAIGGPTLAFGVDHTAYELFDVDLDPAPPDGTDLRLTGALRKAGAAAEGSIALVGRNGTNATKVLGEFDGTGEATVTLPDVERFSRITAVLVNADVSEDGFDPISGDWKWTRDGADAELSLEAVDSPLVGRAPVEPGTMTPTAITAVTDCGITSVERPASTPTPTPTATPTATATPTPTPTPPPATAATLRLSRSTTKVRTLARRGFLPVIAAVNEAGRLTATATVDRATARRLRVGRRATRLGTGRRTATRAGRLKVNIRLSRKARAGLKRQRRTLRVKVRTTFLPADGGAAITRTISVLLRP